jgi:Protein of unknown function (DUF1826)
MRTSLYSFLLTYISGHYLSSAMKLERPSASLLLQKSVSQSLIYLESPRHDDTCLCGDTGGVNIGQMANFDNTYGGKRSVIELDMADTVSRIIPTYLAEQPNFSTDVSEMIRLVTTFALPDDHISCRLALINGIRCPKWHEDNVNLRLIKTYYGVGTDWVDPSDVTVRMNNYFRSLMDWDLEVKDKKKIKSARVDDILLISGKASPDSSIVPVLHRSPLVPESDRRLLLTVTIS